MVGPDRCAASAAALFSGMCVGIPGISDSFRAKMTIIAAVVGAGQMGS